MNTYHFVKAFRAIRDQLHETQLEMLKAHHQAPNYTVTMTQLAERVGYADYSAANLHYGTLGRLLAEELGWHPQDEHAWLSVIVDFYRQGDEHWQLVLHPTAVKALDELHWW